MTEPKFNPTTGTVEFPKPEAAKEKAAPEEMVYMAIPKNTVAQLVTLAKKDGADLSAETAKGEQAKATKAARVYVLGAIGMLLNARKSSKQAK